MLARSLGVLKREEVSKAMRSCYPEYTVPKRRVGVSLVEDSSSPELLGDETEVMDPSMEFD